MKISIDEATRGAPMGKLINEDKTLLEEMISNNYN